MWLVWESSALIVLAVLILLTRRPEADKFLRMTLKRATVTGWVAALLSYFFLVARPVQLAMHLDVSRFGLWICPLTILVFANLPFHLSLSAALAIVVIGNGPLYALGGLIVSGPLYALVSKRHPKLGNSR